MDSDIQEDLLDIDISSIGPSHEELCLTHLRMHLNNAPIEESHRYKPAIEPSKSLLVPLGLVLGYSHLGTSAPHLHPRSWPTLEQVLKLGDTGFKHQLEALSVDQFA